MLQSLLQLRGNQHRQDTDGIVSLDTDHLGVDEDYSKFKALVEKGDGGDDGDLSVMEPSIEAPPPPLVSTAAQVSRRLSNDPPVCSVGGGFIDCVNGKVRGTSLSCSYACSTSGGSCCEANTSFNFACSGFTGEYILCVVLPSTSNHYLIS